jgi:hypothetical protein
VTVESVAADYQARQIQIAAVTANQMLRLWGRVTAADISASWAAVAPAAAVVLTRGQVQAAASADSYLDSVAGAFGGASFANGPVDPSGYGGVSSDGQNLSGILVAPVVASKNAITAGASVEAALQAGGSVLRVIAASQVADAGRSAVEVAMFTRDEPPPASAEPSKGPGGRMFVKDGNGRTVPHFRARSYVRFANPGACSRCIILAGKKYGKQAPFLRHPHCHCTHIPVDENLDDYPATDPKAYYDSLSDAERIKTFGKAGARAIDEGADMNQVVNARQGMFTTGSGQLTTRAGTTKRGLFGASQPGGVRLMPEEIFKIAQNREDALRLLRQYRYII